MPKEMLPIINKPTIQYIVEEAIASGIEDIIIVTGKGKRAIEDHFDNAFELESGCLRMASWNCLRRYSVRPRLKFTISGKRNPKAWAMRSGAQDGLSATSRSA